MSSETYSAYHFVKLAQVRQIEVEHMLLPEESVEADQDLADHKRLLVMSAEPAWIEPCHVQEEVERFGTVQRLDCHSLHSSGCSYYHILVETAGRSYCHTAAAHWKEERHFYLTDLLLLEETAADRREC